MARPVRRRVDDAVSDPTGYLDDEDETFEDEHPRRRPSRPVNRDDSERPEPRRNTARPDPAKVRKSLSGGWDAVDRAATESSSFVQLYKLQQDEEHIFAFVDEAPFVVYKLHWIQEISAARKGYPCLKSFDDDDEYCPLCDIGDRPRQQVLFNVIDMADRTLKVWVTGVKLAQKIKAFAKKERTRPINRVGLYWCVTKTGSGTKTDHNLYPVSEDRLADWDTEPLTDKEYAKLIENRQDASYVRFDSVETLEELAEELSR